MTEVLGVNRARVVEEREPEKGTGIVICDQMGNGLSREMAQSEPCSRISLKTMRESNWK